MRKTSTSSCAMTSRGSSATCPVTKRRRKVRSSSTNSARCESSARTSQFFRQRCCGLALVDDRVVFHVPGTNQLAGDHTGKPAVGAMLRKFRELTGGTFRLQPIRIFADDTYGVVIAQATATRNGRTISEQPVQVGARPEPSIVSGRYWGNRHRAGNVWLRRTDGEHQLPLPPSHGHRVFDPADRRRPSPYLRRKLPSRASVWWRLTTQPTTNPSCSTAATSFCQG